MTQEQIQEAKLKYGKIFKLTINGIEWYYRAMSRPEFKEYTSEQIGENKTQLDLEDLVFIKCNLNGLTTVDSIPAGVVSLVADAIMKATGFTEEVEPEEL